MNQTLLVLQDEQVEIKSIATAIKYCYKKIIFNQENLVTYTGYLAQFLEDQSAKEFLKTFKQLRAFSYGQNGWNWFNINPSILSGISSEQPSIFWAWLTCHPNGYVRELALEKIVKVSFSKRIPFLLVTLSDHIQKLRTIAEDDISKLVVQENEEMILFSFPLIKRLKVLEQKECLAIYNQLNSYLLGQFSLLQKAQDHENICTSRYGFELSFKGDEKKRALTIKNGLKKNDKTILKWTFQELQKEENWEKEYLTNLLEHPQMLIRKSACEWCYGNSYQDKRMIPKLLDQSSSIKDLALTYVQKYFPEIDCRKYYLQHLIESPTNAVQGLAILQDIRDKDKMLPLINSTKKKIRISVLKWAECLPQKEQLPLCIECLSDSSRDVRKKAVDQLIQNYSPHLKEQLIVLFKEANEINLQLNVMKILGEENRKDYFFTICSLYVDAKDQLVKDEIEQAVVGWLSNWNQRFFLSFSLKDKVELTYLLNKHYHEYSSRVTAAFFKILRTK